MICSGIDAVTGEAIVLEFDRSIRSVRPAEAQADAPFLAPGFVDLQINGFAGVDFNDPNAAPEEIGRAVDAILATGVTRCLPTVITGPPDGMLACLRNLARVRHGAVAGFHVEGPHIGPDDGPRGVHPARWVRPPDLEEFARMQEAADGRIRLATVSPHWPESPRYIGGLVNAGVTVAIGHTGATQAQISAAVDAGATLSTHLGNAAPKLLPKFPNLLLDQLAEDRLSACFIVDGIHLDEAFLRVAVRAKGLERTILVTDASAPAGTVPGRYRLGELDVDLTPDDRVVLAGGSKLAGSALRMDRAIANLMRIARVSPADAIPCATVNPARSIRLTGRTKGLVPGDCADIVVFRNTSPMRIEAVYLDGERVV